MQSCSKKQGFTLVELLLATVAAAIVSLTVSLVLVMTLRSLRTNNEYARLRRDMAYAVETMAKEVRKANGIRLNAPASTLVLTNNLNELEVDETNEYRDNGAGRLIHFRDGVEQVPVVAGGLRSFAWASTNNSGVVLSLEMEGNGGETVVRHETTIHMRNKLGNQP